MSKIFVSGLLNVETSVNVHAFPVEYSPIDYSFFAVNSDVSGVGYNVARALTELGDNVALSSLIGKDMTADTIMNTLKLYNIDTEYVRRDLKSTPQSVVLYDDAGKRKVYCDLKNIQDCIYQKKLVEKVISDCDALVLCNINFNDELIHSALQYGKTVFTDVHILSDINDEYNKRFMKNSDVLFLSDEGVCTDKAQFILQLHGLYNNKIIVMGCGNDGVLMLDGKQNRLFKADAVYTRKVINTCGAGDALFSCFVHEYVKGKASLDCLKSAVTFASYKIGESGGANGFLPDDELEKQCKLCNYNISCLNE